MHAVLNESTRNRTMGDVPICTMLSGGIDSVSHNVLCFEKI